MFQIPMHENTTHHQLSQSESSPYQTEGISTEFKQHPEACRMDMDARMSKRSVRFGEGNDSEQPSDSEGDGEMEGVSYN